MEDNRRILLLKVIKFNGDLSPLLKLGYTYSQITAFIRKEIANNYAEQKNGILSLTDTGNSFIEDYNKNNNRLSAEKWIEPEIESKIPIFNLDDVYLPDQNELTF